MLLSVNGRAVLRGVITFPLTGRPWHATLSVDGGEALSGSATIESARGDMTLNGTVLRGTAFAKRVDLFLVGGAGGLSSAVTAKYYKGVPLRIPLVDILSAVGEALSSTADASVTNTFLDRWTRSASSAAAALGVLLATTPTSWRVQDDGTVWVGSETWPTATLSYQAIDEATDLGAALIGPAAFTLRPGTTFNGRKVAEVEYVIEPEQVRAWVRYQAGVNPGTNRVAAALDAFVRRMLAPTLYYATFPAKVVKQASDGTLELQPDDSRIPGLTNVPVRYGLPGIKATVSTGARCRVGFENGDPKSPYAYAFDENAGYVDIKLNDGVVPGAFPVARATIDTAGPYPITGGCQKLKLPL